MQFFAKNCFLFPSFNGLNILPMSCAHEITWVESFSRSCLFFALKNSFNGGKHEKVVQMNKKVFSGYFLFMKQIRKFDFPYIEISNLRQKFLTPTIQKFFFRPSDCHIKNA